MQVTTLENAFENLTTCEILLCLPGQIKKTVYLVGKGISYDTGGADIKAGGVMAGMSRYVTQRGKNSILCADI